MRSPVISDQFLVENSAARGYHQTGMDAALGAEPDFDEALKHLEEAEGVLVVSEPTIDRNVQLARVRRDRGFTIVRRALVLEDAELLNDARIILQGSAQLTEAASGQRGEIPYDPAGEPSAHGTRKHARREIFSEHGATLGTLARLTTAEQVLLEKDTSGDSEEAVKARLDDQAFYGAAHDFLTIGSNGYYLVSNAMCGARQEVLNGKRMGSNKWLVRAGRGLVWAVTHDSRNIEQAFATAGSRARHLRSQDAAYRSVFSRP